MGQCNDKGTINETAVKQVTEEPKMDATKSGGAIISADDLKALVDKGPVNLRILDVTIGGKEAYEGAHIPGAVYMDIFHNVEHTEYLIRNLPKADDFQTYVRTLGISADSDVILYDTADSGGGYMSSGRAWYLFKYHGLSNVRILDGGLDKWKNANYETTTDIPSPQEGDFTASVKGELLVTFEEVLENLESNKYQVIDTRPPGGYGQGHIANAKNLPFGGKLVDPENKCLRSLDQLKAAFEEAGVDLSKPLFASCMGGMTSCTALIAASLLGKNDVPLYLGSWGEWSKRATGEQIQKS